MCVEKQQEKRWSIEQQYNAYNQEQESTLTFFEVLY